MSEFLIDLATPLRAAQVGGKAANLAKLRARGLQVPDALIVPADVFERDQAHQMRRDLANAWRKLGPALMVRSSASIEDGEASSAAGVFVSLPADSLDELEAAVKAVWGSARSDTAQAFAGARGIDLDDIAMSVIVQRRIDGRRGVVYTRRPGSPDVVEVIIEIDGGPGALGEAERDRIAATALQAEEAIDAPDGADVEIVLDGKRLYTVQARPIVHPPRIDTSAVDAAIAEIDWPDETVWRWDVTHNPEPMSAAQTGLVERMVTRGAAPSPMRVIAGYLYCADVGVNDDDPTETPTAESLRACYDQVVPAIENALRGLEEPRAPSLANALAGYENMYRIYAGVLTPALSRARRHVRSELAGRPPETVAALVASGASALDRLLARVHEGELTMEALTKVAGPLAATWDVRAPTYAERPGLLEQAVARYRRSPGHHDHAVELDSHLGALAEAVREIGGADDILYARAQTAVRRAMLAIADGWGLQERDDVFHVPLERLCADAKNPTPPGWFASSAQRGRQALAVQERLAMPLAIAQGTRVPELRPAESPYVLRGLGVGGHARGRITRIDPNRLEPVPADHIVLARTLTPATVFLVHGARGIISEHGGLLGHGAAIARELNLPCVVGCAGAWGTLADGDFVRIDGTAGLVLRLPEED